MRTRWICFITLVLFLIGCKAPVATQSGREDIAYLIFSSHKDYFGKEVNVTIDNQTNFKAKVVNSSKVNSSSTKQYGIATGRKKLVVTYGGSTIYQKEIFVSSQDTKVITLP